MLTTEQKASIKDKSWSGSWFPDGEGEKACWQSLKLRLRPLASQPQVWASWSLWERGPPPTSSVLLPHQNIRKILGSFQLQILKEDRTQMNTSVQKIQQSESKLGGNKVVTTKNQACPMIISDTVNSEYNLHDKAGSKPLSIAGSEAKCKPGSCDNLCKGPRAELGGAGGSDREPTRGHGTSTSAPSMRGLPALPETCPLGDAVTPTLSLPSLHRPFSLPPTSSWTVPPHGSSTKPRQLSPQD